MSDLKRLKNRLLVRTIDTNNGGRKMAKFWTTKEMEAVSLFALNACNFYALCKKKRRPLSLPVQCCVSWVSMMAENVLRRFLPK